MNSYHELLESYIKNSALSHREVSRRCKDRGVSVSQPYISQLVKGDVNPPSEDVSRVLAEVTGGDPDKLIMAAYMEKAPDEVKEIIKKSGDIDHLLKRIFDFYFNYMVDKDLLKNVELDDLSDLEVDQRRMQVMFSALSANPSEYFERLTLDEKLGLLDVIEADAKEKNLSLTELLGNYNIGTGTVIKEKKAPYVIDTFRKIPVLGTITAGVPIERNEYIEGYEMIEIGTLRGRDSFILKVKGDSMIGDRIYDGDRVVVVSQPEVLPTDIAVVAVNGEEATLKRVKIQNNMCILLPSNPAMEPMLFPANEVHILGKVIEVRHSLE